MGNNDSRQANHEFHKGNSGSCNNSVMMMSDAFTYNGFGGVTPGRNDNSQLSMYPDGPKDALFEQREGVGYYKTNAEKIDSMMPEFIGMSNKNSAMQSYNSVKGSPERKNNRAPSLLDRSSLSRSSVEYDAPLTVTGLDILDSVPRIGDLG